MERQLVRKASAFLQESLIPEGRDARLLGGLHFADAVSKGIFLSGSAVYFTMVTGMSAGQVALGVSAAGASGFVASLLLGMVADRLGAARLLFLMLLLQAAGFLLYPLVGGFAFFLVLITSLGFVEYGGGPAFGSIIGSIAEQGDRVRIRAAMRSLFNVGFSLGSAITAVAILGGDTLIRSLPFATSALLLVAALMTLRLPAVGNTIRRPERLFGAIRDLRFMWVVVLSAPLALHGSIILVVLPLWIVTQSEAPAVLVPVLLIANTVLVVLTQVRMSGGADTVEGAADVARRSALWLAGGCVLIAGAAYFGSVTAAALICVAALLLTAAELRQSASAWGLSYGLAPEHSQAEYLGAFNLHVVAQNVVGPVVVVALLGTVGSWGWLLVAMVILGAGLLTPAAVRSAAFRRTTASDRGIN